MKYFKIIPNCSGFGFEIEQQKKRFNQSNYYKGYFKIESLGFEFDIFPLEDIISGSREIYLISDILKKRLELADLSGFSIGSVRIQYSLNYQHFHPDKQNLNYHWFNVIGIAGQTDFGLTERYELVISKRAFVFLKEFNISHLEIAPFGDLRI